MFKQCRSWYRLLMLNLQAL